MKYICQMPGKKSREIIARDKKVISESNAREYDFVFKKAKGNYLWDVDGHKYLDFASCIAVMNVGHCNPEVIKAIKQQLNFGLHSGFNDFFTELPVLYAEELIDTVKHLNLNNVFFSNSGTEAVEAMYKCARWHSNKKWVIAFKNAFHGRTMGSLSMTDSKPVQRERFAPFMPVKHSEFPYLYRSKFGSEKDLAQDCLNKLEKTMNSVKGDLAGVFLEPIQGEGGYIIPSKEFIQGVRKLCFEHGTLMCVDEVQSGCFRTGEFLAIENFQVKPDLVAMSKAIGGGIPLGATLANKKLMDWVPGSHSNTFGGNLIACAAGRATLNYLKKYKLGLNAKKIGKILLKDLNRLKEENELIGDVRGIGLMIGVEIVKSKKSKEFAPNERHALLCKAQEKGLILLPCGKSSIRFSPPLTLTEGDAWKGLDIFEDALKEVTQ